MKQRTLHKTTCLQKSQNDHCMFTKGSHNSFLALVIYVDDILISGSNPTKIKADKEYLHSLFTIKDLDQAKYFLGIEVARTTSGITISKNK